MVQQKEIEIPADVTLDLLSGLHVRMKGPKGSCERDFTDPRLTGLLEIEKHDNHLIVQNKSQRDTRTAKALAGTIRAHIRNMIRGVTNGYEYTMKIHYVHFPMNVTTKDGRVIVKNFLGEKGERSAGIVGSTSVKIDKEFVIVSGTEIEEVGQTAANIERACRQTKKDRRIFQDGIYIQHKGTAQR